MEYNDAAFGRKIKRIGIAALILAVLIGAGVFSVNLYIDYLEVLELGQKFTSVFWTNMGVRLITQAASFVLVFFLFFVNTVLVKRNMSHTKSPIITVVDKLAVKIVISVVFSLIASTFISETVYNRYLMFANSVPFDLVDPIFGHDIGYYIFTRPFLAALVDSLLAVWMVAAVYCILFYVVIYAVNGLLHFDSITLNKPMIVHNVVNIVIFFVIKAVTYKFKSEEVLYSSIGEVAGAGFTDINIWYNFYRAAPFLLLAIVVVSLILLFRGKIKATIITVAVYPASMVLVALVAVAVQGLVVSPNEAIKERPYLEHNIKYTRMAYRIDNVTELEFPADNTLTQEDLEKNEDTLNNIRVLDFASTQTAINSLQGIRNYYKFKDVDVAKYEIDGHPTLVSIAAREMDKENLDETAKTYVNQVFRFTHGFGAVMNPLNTVTEEGQPEFLIKDIPPVSEPGVPEITQPRIYYGEVEDDDYVIVNSTIKELDYAEGSSEVEYSYDGSGGIRLGWFNRLLYSIKNADFKMLISQYVTPESRIMMNRNVLTRLEKAAPFLTFDDDPYLVINDAGRLQWVVDAYTTSTYYPYSQTYHGINYIRNSVKAVVDAYDGSIQLYVIDETDPIIQCYQKMFPKVFETDPLPQDIAAHTVYPEALFRLQAEVYAKYHVTNPNTFYNKSDLWEFGKEKYGSEVQSMEPYYNLAKVEGLSDDQECIVMIPYTLSNKENMVSWLAASCEMDNYGKLVAYQFPRGKNVYGTLQIESRIDNDPTISREMTLWGQGGSAVVRGNMLVVPIEDSLLYMEPIYITTKTAQNGAAIPELKRVAVAYNDKIVMEPTLEQALAVLFEGQAPSGPVASLETDPPESDPPSGTDEGEPEQGEGGSSDLTLDEVIDQITEGYYNAQNYSAQGDWNGFGENMQKLDEAIKELEKFRRDKTKPPEEDQPPEEGVYGNVQQQPSEGTGLHP